MPEEAKKTKKGRSEIIKMLEAEGYKVTEEEVFPCKNNMNEEQILFYQADIVATKKMIVELDPDFHRSHIHIVKDSWRDKNIFREYQIPTVRIDPKDILKLDNEIILEEIDSQLRSKKYQQ